MSDNMVRPQDLKKYTGSIYENRSKAKNGSNKIISFSACIKTANFKYYKCFPLRQEAEADLIKQNIKNKLEIKNTMWDCGNYYKVKLSGNKNFLADKCDLHFIENHIWFSNTNYASCNQNGRQIRFHNLILGYVPSLKNLKSIMTLKNLKNQMKYKQKKSEQQQKFFFC